MLRRDYRQDMGWLKEVSMIKMKYPLGVMDLYPIAANKTQIEKPILLAFLVENYHYNFLQLSAPA